MTTVGRAGSSRRLQFSGPVPGRSAIPRTVARRLCKRLQRLLSKSAGHRPRIISVSSRSEEPPIISG